MSGAGFGAFMQGLQGGIEFGQNVRKNRQKEKLYDAAINEALDAKKSRKLSTAAADALANDGETTETSDYELPDPYGYDLMDMAREKIGSLFKPKKKALPVEDPQELPQLTPMDPEQFAAASDTSLTALQDSVPGLAGGGLIDDLMVAGEVAARRAGRAVASGARGAGAAVRAIPTLPEDAGMLRRAGGGKLGTGLAAGVLGAGALQGGATDTEDYYRRMPYLPHNAETPGGQFAQDLLARSLGVASDVAGALPIIGPKIRENFNDVEEDAAKQQAIPAPKPEAGPSAPLGSPQRTRAMSRGSGRAALPAAADKDGNKKIDPLEGLDLGKMKAEDLPSFSTTDWTKFRNASVRALTLRGVPIGEAMDTVDKQVLGIQTRGIQMFGNQALLRLSQGDLEGAQPYIRAAFQYVPSTTDVKTVVHNGHLIAVGYDEETGEPVGQPFVVNEETLSKVLQQMTQPGTMAEWAQDRREFKLREQEAQARSDYLANQNEIGMTRAEADIMTAEGKAGAGGVKPVDVERVSGDLTTGAQMIADQLELEEGDAEVIAAVMSLMYRQALQAGRTVGAPQIIEAARRNVQTRGMEYMRSQLTGQQ